MRFRRSHGRSRRRSHLARHPVLLAVALALAACQGAATGSGANDDEDAADEPQKPDVPSRSDARAEVRADARADRGATSGADAAHANDAAAPDAGVDMAGDSEPEPEDAAAPDDGGRPGAAGVTVGLVEIAQAVFIKLGDGATVVAPADRNSTLIEDRAAFLRAYVKTMAGFTARPLHATLTVSYADGSARAFEDEKRIAASSTPEALESSFNFLLPADAMKPEAKMALAVYETTGPGAAAVPRFPAAGSADLAIAKGRMHMEVVLVPVRGPSGPLDDSPARRQHLEGYLADVYPVQSMTIRWHAPLTVTKVINASTALAMLQTARKDDGAAPSAYYHMLIAAEDCSDKYLGLGVVAGFRPSDAPNRIAMTMVTEHQVDSQMDTVSHEMGHNLGRAHAPGCDAAGVDPKFPYANTGVGVNGFSLGELATGRMHLPNAPGPWKSKARFKDVMGYCYPTWISDYTWNAFAVRIRLLEEITPSMPGTQAAPSRSLQGFYAPGRPPAWVVVEGQLVPEGTPVTAQRWARVVRADGSVRVLPVNVDRLRSPAGPEDDARVLAVDLADEDDVARVELSVDGDWFAADATEVEGL